MKLTQKIAREYLAFLDCKLRRNAEYGEYVLVYGADQTYHTSDIGDVIETARVMAGGHDRFEDAEEYLALMIERN